VYSAMLSSLQSLHESLKAVGPTGRSHAKAIVLIVTHDGCGVPYRATKRHVGDVWMKFGRQGAKPHELLRG
jgi:hypothetical protein